MKNPTNRRKFLSLSFKGAAGLLLLTNDAFTRLHNAQSPKIFEQVFDCDPATMQITPNDQFYILGQKPTLPAVADYRLDVIGLVSTVKHFTYNDVTALPVKTYRDTLECVSNPVGGNVIGNAEWVGTNFQNIADAVGVRQEAQYAVFYGLDQYVTYQPVSVLLSLDTMIAWKMNGVPIPEDHGWPLRLICPGYYGYKNPKWIYKIEFVDAVTALLGTYESTGWSKTGTIKTMSKTISPADQTTISGDTVMCGVGFSPNAGIQAVQLSFDDGKTWVNADLTYKGLVREWILWSYTWKPTQNGTYPVVVRIIDSQGVPQDSTQAVGFPDGASGWHRIVLTVQLGATPVEIINGGDVPKSFNLHQNYPNPFNSDTRITYDVPTGARVSLTVYNILGQPVKTLVDGFYSAGIYGIIWDGTNNSGRRVASGVYLLRMIYKISLIPKN